MLIASAYASAGTAAQEVGAGEAMLWNFGLIGILVIMFYVLLIAPQQKRFKEHRAMLDGLNKGDRVVTAGGLIGKVDKLVEEKDEVVVDLGGGIKVTAVRSTIQTALETPAKKRDEKAAEKKADEKKTVERKKKK